MFGETSWGEAILLVNFKLQQILLCWVHLWLLCNIPSHITSSCSHTEFGLVLGVRIQTYKYTWPLPLPDSCTKPDTFELIRVNIPSKSVYQAGYIVNAPITATHLLFMGQLAVTPGSSQRSAGSKGRGPWQGPGQWMFSNEPILQGLNDCLSTWCSALVPNISVCEAERS